MAIQDIAKPPLEKLLAGLNTAQRTAVTSTEGPALIIAGAGTGKTKVITHRLAYLLATRADLHPENILALTYTRKAAEEMATRVEALLPELSGIPKVMTFHSFALELVEEHGRAVGISPKTKLLAHTLERAAFLEPILWELPLDSFSEILNRESLIVPILRFIDRAKDELVSPEEFRAYVKRLETGPETREAEDLAEIYSRYEARLRKEDALDFGGLIQAAIRLLKTRAGLAKKLSAQYRYLLVDEFQDTNVAQIELLRLLAGGEKNLCVVGDDDQAIYRFRGASYASFKKFRELFPEAKILKLTQNYRSTQNILSVASASIALNGKDRYDEAKELTTDSAAGGRIALHLFPSYDEEAAWIAQEIKKIWRPSGGESIAVLIRAHSHGEKIKEALRAEGIPFAESASRDLFENEEVRDALAFLYLIGEKEEDISLARLLLGPYVGIHPEKYRTLSLWAKEKGKPLAHLLTEIDGDERIASFREKLFDLKALARRASASELFWELLVRFRLLSGYLHKGTREAEEAVQHLGLFYDFILRFEEGDRKATLKKLLHHLELAQELDLDLALDEELPASNAVRLLTIHGAKGLEFRTVFLASVTDRRFPSREKEDLFPFPDALMKEALPQGDFHEEEERRLFYVALTRAQEKLYLSAVEKKPGVKPSVFIREILASEAKDRLTVIKHEAGEGTVSLTPRFRREMTRQISPETSEQTAPTPMPPAPAKLTLSHTQIESYEWCPLKYRFRFVYLVPQRKSPHLTFGNNMHKALEEFYRRIKDGKKPSGEDLLEIFEASWDGRGFKNKTQEETYRKKGRELAKAYFRMNTETFQLPQLFIEEPFLIKIRDDIEIRGKIDRVQQSQTGEAEVIDYKTGKAKDQKYADTSLQLSIYAMALEQMAGLKVGRVCFYYLEPGEIVSTQIHPERLEEARGEIIETAEKIRSGEFPPCPEKDRFMKCRLCEYKPICPVWEK